MTKNKKTIMDYENCPHCGSNFGYYVKSYLSGWIHDKTLFSTESIGTISTGVRVKENAEMYDGMKESRIGKYYLCIDCNKRICKREEY